MAKNGKLTILSFTLLIAPLLLGTGCSDSDTTGGVMSMQPNIVETAIADGNFGTLVAAVQAAGLVDTLSGTGPFTVFAPTDAAFAKLPAGTLDDLLKPENKSVLQEILLYHVVPGQKYASDVVGVSSLATAQGQSVAITVNGNQVFVNQAEIIQTDIQTSNGVIHVIDEVLIP
jgi:uncharacterized surface protein with fasciclin (FAS1) repeats